MNKCVGVKFVLNHERNIAGVYRFADRVWSNINKLSTCSMQTYTVWITENIFRIVYFIYSFTVQRLIMNYSSAISLMPDALREIVLFF